MVSAAAPFPPQPPKKKTSGCLIALAIVGGLVVLIALIVGIALWRFFESPEGKKIANVVGESVKIMADAQNAPGARELTHAGCTQGMVMDMDRWKKLTEELSPDASLKESDFPARLIVVCSVNSFAKAPTCESVKNTYLAAVPDPPGRILAQVSIQGNNKPICQTIYEPDGTFVRDYKPSH